MTTLPEGFTRNALGHVFNSYGYRVYGIEDFVCPLDLEPCAHPSQMANVTAMVYYGELTDKEAMYYLFPKNAAAIYEGAHGITNQK